MAIVTEATLKYVLEHLYGKRILKHQDQLVKDIEVLVAARVYGNKTDDRLNQVTDLLDEIQK
jgi:hypothetical protein